MRPIIFSIRYFHFKQHFSRLLSYKSSTNRGLVRLLFNINRYKAFFEIIKIKSENIIDLDFIFRSIIFQIEDDHHRKSNFNISY
jgi:hypothetical protein